MKSKLLVLARAAFTFGNIGIRMLCILACCRFVSFPVTSNADDEFGNMEFPQVEQADDEQMAALRTAILFHTMGVDIPLGFNNNEPAIAVDPNNPLRIAVATYLSIRVSTDGGNTFQPAVGAGVPPTHSSNRGGDSSLAFDSQGRLFWTYLLITNGPSASAFDVFVAQCNPTTGALLAGYPVNVTASAGVNLPAPSNCHDKEWLAVDSTTTSPFRDRLYIVWTQFLSSGTRVQTTWSGNQGATWSAAVTLSGSGEGFVWPSHNTVAPNGDVYVAYHSQPTFDGSGATDGTSGRIYVLRSTDGGATYPQKTTAFAAGQADLTFNRQTQNGPIAGARFWLQGSVQPWVLADPNTAGRIYVVANDDPDNNHASGDNANVYIAISTDNGMMWGAPARVDGGPGTTFQVMPTAAIDRNTGCITVHYYDNRRGLTNSSGRFLLDVFATRSTDGGVTFGADFRINDTPFDPDPGAGCRWDCGGSTPTTRIGEYNGVAIAGGLAFAVWCGNTVDGSGNPTGQQTFFERYPCDPCTLTCPASRTVGNDPDQCGARVTFPNPTTSGGCGVIVGCSPSSGSFFALGTTTVTCTSASGDTCSFTVTVNDTQAPAINCPANIVQATDPGLCSAVVNFTVTATDNCPGVSASCSPPPGSTFPKGTTTVACTATDGAGNKSSCSFTVTVEDHEPPVVTCPADIVQANDPGLCSAVVTFIVTATDNCPSVTVACNPPSGSVFPKGTNAVTCTATDASGNQSSCAFTVIVLDKEPPRVSCQPGTNPSGNNTPSAGSNPRGGENPDGFYQVLAVDNCDPNPKIYVKDSASSFVAGPFANGDTLKIIQAPGVTPNQEPGPGVTVARVHLKGDALIYGVDADDNVSVPIPCRVPPPPK